LTSSRYFNKLVIKVKMHAKTLFLRYDMISFLFFLERHSRMYENKKNKFIFIYLLIIIIIILQKPSI